jgi:phosphoenolpyruvate carboxykinase (GTP)
MRVVEWIIDRVRGRAAAIEGPLGLMPRRQDLTWTGLDYLTPAAFAELMTVERATGLDEAEAQLEQFAPYGAKLPAEFVLERQLLEARLSRAPERWRP